MDLARYVLCGRKLTSFEGLVYGQVCILWVIVESQRSVDLARYVLCGRKLTSFEGLVYDQVCILWVNVESHRSVDLARYLPLSSLENVENV